MEFRTKISVSPSSFDINYRSRLLLLGSCFAENIGQLLTDNKFRVNINPFGILYNPASIAKVLDRLCNNQAFTESELIYDNGLYHSFMHHGRFSNPDRDECLSQINESFDLAVEDLKSADVLLITFGTAYAYIEKKSSSVVANCHKFPAADFRRYRLSVSEIVEQWSLLIEKIHTLNPKLKVLFTVSPIRHWKDGAHDNQLSKSVLLLTIDELQSKFDYISYFPSYEIILDELRDYRFYAEDMVHPNELAIKYIWSVFEDIYLTNETKETLNQWLALKKAIEHRPFNSQIQEHKCFLRQTLLKLDVFNKKYPYFECEKEKLFIQDQLL